MPDLFNTIFTPSKSDLESAESDFYHKIVELFMKIIVNSEFMKQFGSNFLSFDNEGFIVVLLFLKIGQNARD